MFDYVPTYLTNVERGYAGWPKFLSEDDRVWLTKAVREVLDERGPLPLWQVEQVLSYSNQDNQHYPLKGVALWDARYAAIHRALLAANAEQVWQLPKP